MNKQEKAYNEVQAVRRQKERADKLTQLKRRIGDLLTEEEFKEVAGYAMLVDNNDFHYMGEITDFYDDTYKVQKLFDDGLINENQRKKLRMEAVIGLGFALNRESLGLSMREITVANNLLKGKIFDKKSYEHQVDVLIEGGDMIFPRTEQKSILNMVEALCNYDYELVSMEMEKGRQYVEMKNKNNPQKIVTITRRVIPILGIIKRVARNEQGKKFKEYASLYKYLKAEKDVR